MQGLTGANLRWMFTDFDQAIPYKPLSWLAWAVLLKRIGCEWCLPNKKPADLAGGGL